MLEEESKNKLSFPLSKPLADFIKQEHPDIGAFLVSTIEFTIKDSDNQYADVMRSVEPLLKEKTKNFVSKIFMFKKTPCSEGAQCTRSNCILNHDSSDSFRGKRVSFDLPSAKKSQNLNPEVVFNRVDETMYNIENIREYASKFGEVVLLRRLNRGKYLIVFDNSDTAQECVDCSDPVLGDRNIKKFYNVIAQLEMHKRQDITVMLSEQNELLNKLTISPTDNVIAELKQVTARIRNYIQQKEGRNDNRGFKRERENPAVNIENSIYSNMFSK